MANPGVGTKFASVNLNKSYGQPSHHHSSHSSSYASSRSRPSGHGGGGGVMVVLSRPRSSQKAGPKLSVPPPLNLPSLRKEHEKFDSLGLGGGPAGGGVSGSGSRPTSSGMGWTKPAAAALQETKPFGEQTVDGFDNALRPVDGFSRGSSAYMPPSARSAVVGGSPATSAAALAHPSGEKVAVLRGEDFPSLRATLSSGPPQKLKENLNPKHKQSVSDNLSTEQTDGSRLTSHVDIQSQFHPSHGSVSNGLSEDGIETQSFRSSYASDYDRKQEDYFLGPLPIVRLKPRSDWADDERDTSHGLTDRSREARDHVFSKNEAYWDRDFDLPRVGAMPHRPALNFDKWGQRDNETGKVSSSEVPKLNPVRASSREGREGNSWRNSTLSKEGFAVQGVGNEKNGVGVRPSSMNREAWKDNKYIPSTFQDNLYDDFRKREMGYGQKGRQSWNNTMDSYNGRGPERNVRDTFAGNEQYNRYSSVSVQSSVSKSSSSVGAKGLPADDPLLNFNREKRTLTKSEKSFLEDPFMKDFGASGFDGRDLFSASLVGMVKKKKEVPKQMDFHDPARESFEAEIEKVQRMQEQERQRNIEEHERALELARREEEERLRQIREQEERQRRLEEEAREAAWRAEQEQIEALRKAEEQKVAREEEKRRILLEEERRKQAAKQKLLELEERIARRKAEAARVDNDSLAVADEKMAGIGEEKDASRHTDVGNWDDGERVVEGILTSGSSISSSLNKSLETSSRPQFPRDSSSSFVDRGKPGNSWRRDVYENERNSIFYLHGQGNGPNSPSRDSPIGGKPLMRKEFDGGAGFMTSRASNKGGFVGAHLDEYANAKGQRWNEPGNGDHLSRNTEIDSDFPDNLERFSDGWTPGRSHGNMFSAYPEHHYPNSESDGSYAVGRSRYSVRQPRVLPPPSLTSVPKTYRDVNAHPNPAAVQANDIPTGYDDAYQRNSGQPEVVGALSDSKENEDHIVESPTVPRCDSQSSLSVSSPPSSPTHLSHDDLEDSGASPAILASVEGKNGPLSGQQNEAAVNSARAGNENVVSSTCAFSSGDDEEWTTENHEQFQEQEEYDEDENYQEEDEVHEGEDNVALNQEFENMNLEEKGLPHMMDNLVLGFDEGVQVGMPNDEFERTLKGEETSFVAQASSGALEEHVCFGNACSDGRSLQPVNSKANLNDPSAFQDSDKTMQDLGIESSKAQTSIVSEGLDNARASNNDLSAHHSKLTSVTSAPYLPSDLSNMSNAASAPSQVELPVKLQFGLFTGPSLIPSPVPAIQIGSIQMPLHLHPHVGAPHSHMHPSQPPLFQFGQLRYTSPISQGMMPVGPQSMSFIQPSIPSEFSFNHHPGGPMPHQTGPDVIDGFVKSEIRSPAVDNQSSNLSRVNLSQGSLPSAENMAGINESQTRIPHDSESSTRTSTGFQMDERGQQPLVVKSSGTLSNARDSEGQPHGRDVSLHLASTEKDFEESKAHYPASVRRGKRYAFVVKGSGSKSSGPAPRLNHPENSGFQRRPRRNIQRTEFRVRVSGEKGLSSGLVSSDQFCSDSKSNINGTGTGTSVKSGPRKVFSYRAGKQAVESICMSSATDLSQDVDSGGRVIKVDGKESAKISGQSHLKRNVCSGEEVDAPLHSGIIRVFEQPGIEAPSDEDDFIEVRSKRQMLNDRREQREKEIKAKSRVAKMPRKPRSASHGAEAKDNYSRGTLPIIEAENSSHSDFVSEGNGMPKIEISSGSMSQPLAPIGTPPLKIDAQPDLRSETSRSLQMSLPAVSGGGKNLGAAVMFESKNKVLNNVQTSLGNAQTSQQVMALTQRQLDEAMKPQQFDSQASGGDLTVNFNKPSLSTSSILTREKPFSSVASPVNSLLAGEKIQFGAVTSPTVLPPSSRALSHGIGHCSSISNMQISHNPAGSDHDCSLFYNKEKHGDGSHDNLEDCEAEAEAEAAASAVAVAAISSDEIAVNGLGTSISVSEARSFGAVDIDGIAAVSFAGVASNQQSAGKARSEEPLSVSLPADLSVETPPISLWPPLPALQNSSQMLSHFPGGPPPHFPFYEMNPMMGGPVFAFGPHDESASNTHPESQKSSMQASGPISSWQQCHSGVDSFYGPAAGFTGPFITPPRGIPGVQGPPPHMVVYNHFAPVGQFGQVGLSFMGATYIPSGKQSDWKHNSTSSAAGAGEGDMSSMNMAPSQRNPVNITAPVQHLAPGSPLVPMASPLAMFDISPFQSSPEMSVQARWPYAPNLPLSSIPLSMPLQEGAHTSQYSHGPSVDQPMNVDRFPISQTSAPSDGDRSFPTGAAVNFNRLPHQLGLVDPSNSPVAKQSALGSVIKTPSVSIIADAGKVDVQSSNASNSNSHSASAAFKSLPLEKNNTSEQYDHSSGYTNYQRSVTQKNSSGGEWSSRRMGLQGRNHTLGADKSFSTSKVKQIYVAKQTTAGASVS
ncbi:uncharacterized protein LOC129293006 isoform X2 [Prosopis cineraria]|uniref:uncharacterized protein LOC129293006 isoform X2 n=1 Tax=Prosopis cineraria TaxID=364024 RepID=UPI00240FA37B|nr:uncharacterized protein LOC129293006 isoform X2 [Prosopis cineraria]